MFEIEKKNKQPLDSNFLTFLSQTFNIGADSFHLILQICP